MTRRGRLSMFRPGPPRARLGTANVLLSGAGRDRGLRLAKIRAVVARRSGGWCECDECRITGDRLPADEFDHVVPLWEGGADTIDNFQHLNATCHAKKTARENRRRLGLDV